MGAPLYPYTGQVGPRFGNSGLFEVWKWCHNIMVEADIHLRLLHTSILNIYKVFEPLVCCLRGTWLHPYTVTPANLPQIWGFRFTWGVKIMPQRHAWGKCPPQTAPYIHFRHVQSVLAIGMLSQGLIVAPIYRYISLVGPRFGDSGSLEKWKWCHNIMFEANIHLRLLHTFILDICKVFKPLVCCLKGIWLHSYTITPTMLAPDWNDASTSCLRLMSTSDCFIHQY